VELERRCDEAFPSGFSAYLDSLYEKGENLKFLIFNSTFTCAENKI